MANPKLICPYLKKHKPYLDPKLFPNQKPIQELKIESSNRNGFPPKIKCISEPINPATRLPKIKMGSVIGVIIIALYQKLFPRPTPHLLNKTLHIGQV